MVTKNVTLAYQYIELKLVFRLTISPTSCGRPSRHNRGSPIHVSLSITLYKTRDYNFYFFHLSPRPKTRVFKKKNKIIQMEISHVWTVWRKKGHILRTNKRHRFRNRANSRSLPFFRTSSVAGGWLIAVRDLLPPRRSLRQACWRGSVGVPLLIVAPRA